MNSRMFVALVLTISIVTTQSRRPTNSENIEETPQDLKTEKHEADAGDTYHSKPEKSPSDREVAATGTAGNPCQTVFCRTGRKCEMDEIGRARCVCGGEDHCKGHQSQVCGSDSKIYQSHCELHRISCLEKSRLGVDHTGRRCRPHETVKPSSPSPGFSTFDTERPNLLPTSTTPMKPKTPKASHVSGETCPSADYNHFKTNLVHYHCARTGNNGCMSDHRKKVSAVTGMFDFYDRDSNKILTPPELQLVEVKDHMDRLSRSCHLKDLFAYEDVDGDRFINIGEFYKAFGLDESVTSNESPSIFTTLVSVGNAVELKCDMAQTKKVAWKRRGRSIVSSEEVKILEDNSLYIGELNLHHMGNYSCHDIQNEEIYQTHVIIVQMPPTVKVYPSSQSHTSGSTVTVKCHVDGVPHPEIVWKKDGILLSSDKSGAHTRYLQLYSNTTLKIKSTDIVKDSGFYSCGAKNSAGSAVQSASVIFTSPDPKSNYNPGDTRQIERFAVFHDSGYTVYELTNCHVEHHVFAEFKVTSLKHNLPKIAQETLCQLKKNCSWGDAVVVVDTLIYVAQPEYQRILSIEMTDRLNPVEVIEIESYPMKLDYVKHLDQIWLTTCSTLTNDCPQLTVKVIREASKNVRHYASHTKEDMSDKNIDSIFLPHQSNNLKDQFNRGYSTSKSNLGTMQIIDLALMKPVGEVNLSEYQCLARDVAYVPIGGYLFVSCEPFAGTSEANFHLVLDYVTHNVLKKSDIGGGMIFVSPDSRYVVILERNGSIISVYKLTADGRLNHLFDEYTQMHLNHLSFFPSEIGVGYNAYAVSYTQNTLLHIELLTGKVTMIEGAEGAFGPSDVIWSQNHRKIAGGGIFYEHLMTSSRNSIIGLDGQRKRIQCHWQSINNTASFLALPLTYE